MSDLEQRTAAVSEIVAVLTRLPAPARAVVLDAVRVIVESAPEEPRRPAMRPQGGAVR